MDQKRIDIFGPKSFMTYEDWHTLTRAEDVIKEAKISDKLRQSRSKKVLGTKQPTPGQQRLKNKLAIKDITIYQRPTKVYIH